MDEIPWFDGLPRELREAVIIWSFAEFLALVAADNQSFQISVLGETIAEHFRILEQVSTWWYHTSRKLLTEHFHAFASMNDYFLRKLPGTQSLKIFDDSSLTRDTLKKLTALKSLIFEGRTDRSKMFMEAVWDLPDLLLLSPASPGPLMDRFPKFTNLTSLRIPLSIMFTDDMLESLQKLRALDIEDNTNITPNSVSLLTNLEVLVLGYWRTSRYDWNQTLYCLPNLKRLSLRRTTSIINTTIRRLTNLISLDLKNAHSVITIEDLQALPKLVDLGLQNYDNIRYFSLLRML